VVCVGMTVDVAVLAHCLIPLERWALPLWAMYGMIEGTVATGCWVVAHEVGENPEQSSTRPGVPTVCPPPAQHRR